VDNAQVSTEPEYGAKQECKSPERYIALQGSSIAMSFCLLKGALCSLT
jgi:hypothetical protein